MSIRNTLRLLILGLDAIRPRQEDKRWLPYVSLVGLVGAFVAAILLWGSDTRVLYVISCDSFALMVKMIAMVAMTIVVLSADVYIRARTSHQGDFSIQCHLPTCRNNFG